jgi:hypothetical protein
MGIIRKYKGLLLLLLVVFAGGFLFFCHFYHHDTKALADLSASYEKFDKAISEYATGQTDDLDGEVEKALGDLKLKAALRLSSLVENDADLMDQAPVVAALSAKELDRLRACKRAIQGRNDGLEEMAKEAGVLAGERKAAYARFRELAGLKAERNP